MQWLILLACLYGPTAAQAHSGHVHSADTVETEAAATTPGALEARFSVAAGRFNLVGIHHNDRLWLYVDDAFSNAPIDGLRIDVDIAVDTGVDIGSEPLRARPLGQGAYLVQSAALNRPGRRDLVLTLLGEDVSELAIATLDTPAATGAPVAAATVPLWDKAVLTGLLSLLLMYLGCRNAREDKRNFQLAVMLGAVGLSGMALSTAYILYNATAVAMPLAADSVSERTPSSTTSMGAAPDSRSRRLADGSLFVPKPAQALLQLRTILAQSRRVAPTRSLSGRVIYDPRDTAVVQAEQSGRLSPPPQGFPLPGTRVAAGDLLGYLHPVLSSADLARQRAELAVLEKDLYLSERQTERVRHQLGTQDTSANVALDVARAEQKALQRRIDLLRGTLAGKLALKAPVDAVIDQVRAINGAVVQAGEEVFTLVDPARFWVEALAPAQFDVTGIQGAEALLPDGTPIPLAFAGHGYRLDNQILPLQFRPLNAAPRLVVGMLLDIRLQSPERIEGVVLPVGAVQSTPGSRDAVVWVRAAAERFEPRRVRLLSLDPGSWLIESGLQSGDRVVEQGATLLSMLQRTAS